MVMPKAAPGDSPEFCRRAFIASTMSDAAQTSKVPALAGMCTKSAVRTASALVIVVPGGPSIVTYL